MKFTADKNASFDVAQGKLLLQRLSSAGVMRAWEERCGVTNSARCRDQMR